MRSTLAAGILLLLAAPGAPASPDVVGFLMWKPGQRGAWTRVIAAFEAANPGTRVRVEEAPPASGAFHALLVTKLRAQDPTLDAFLIDVVWPAELTAAGYLEPVDDLLPEQDRRRLFPAALEAACIGPRAVAVPFNVDGGALYYRADLLAEQGFGPPETWGELERQVKVIRARHPEVVGYTGQFEQYEGLVCNMLEIVASNGGHLERDGQPALGARAEEAVAWVRNRLVGGIAPRAVLNQREPESREVFMQGHAIFHRNWPETWKIANDPVRSKVAGRVGLAPLPRFEGGRSASALGGWALAIAAHSPRKEAARKLVRFLSGYEAQKRLTLETAHVPARADVLDDPDVLAAFPHFKILKKILGSAVTRPKLPDYAAFSDRLQRELYARIAGSGGELGLPAAALSMGLLLALTLLLARGRHRTAA
jgi:multiple sugar transport system substrate-binding protein